MHAHTPRRSSPLRTAAALRPRLHASCCTERPARVQHSGSDATESHANTGRETAEGPARPQVTVGVISRKSGLENNGQEYRVASRHARESSLLPIEGDACARLQRHSVTGLSSQQAVSFAASACGALWASTVAKWRPHQAVAGFRLRENLREQGRVCGPLCTQMSLQGT